MLFTSIVEDYCENCENNNNSSDTITCYYIFTDLELEVVAKKGILPCNNTDCERNKFDNCPGTAENHHDFWLYTENLSPANSSVCTLVLSRDDILGIDKHCTKFKGGATILDFILPKNYNYAP